MATGSTRSLQKPPLAAVLPKFEQGREAIRGVLEAPRGQRRTIPAIVTPLAHQGSHLTGIWLLAGSGRGQLRVSPCPPVKFRPVH